MPEIYMYAKISRLHILSQGESYLSILELLIAEAYGTSLIRSIFLLVSGTSKIPNLITLDYQGRLYFARILYFLIPLLSMPYATILIPLQFSLPQ